MSRINRQLLAIFAVLAGLAGAMVVSTPSQASTSVTSPVALPASAAPKPPAGAVRLGEVSPGTAISLDVTLKVPDSSGLTAFLAGLSDRSSPLFHHFLRPGQFGPMKRRRLPAGFLAVLAVWLAAMQACDGMDALP